MTLSSSQTLKPKSKCYQSIRPIDYSCPVRIFKLSCHIISQPLAQNFNVSVFTGSFPAKLKTAKYVVPIFKSGDESKPGSYTAISLLQIFNRIFDKFVYIKRIKFVDKHSTLNSSQYGIRGKHSTQHATPGILNGILTNFDKGQFTCSLFTDLKRLLIRLITIFLSQNLKAVASEEQ